MNPTPTTSTGPAIAPDEAGPRAADEFAEAGEHQPLPSEAAPASVDAQAPGRQAPADPPGAPPPPVPPPADAGVGIQDDPAAPFAAGSGAPR